MTSSITDLSEQLSKWSSHIEQSKDQLKTELERWQGYIEEYNSLSKQLETFADETVRPAMIPFGKLAFMPGKFIHTNEIMVYLGDQYYVERSTKQALSIIENRKQGIEENLRLVEAQWNAIKMKSETADSNVFPSSEGFNEEGLPIMEIREELPANLSSSSSNDSNKKIDKGKSSALPSNSFVQYDINKNKLDTSSSSSDNNNKNDNDELMNLLNELEKEEEEEELQKQQQLIEQQLSLCNLESEEDEEEGHSQFLEDQDIDEELYDTEIADNMFDHFDDDEEYATQGVVDKEDFSSYLENQNEDDNTAHLEKNINSDRDVIQNVDEKNVINEVVEIPVKNKISKTTISSVAVEQPNKKVSKFKQARLEQMKNDKQDEIPSLNEDIKTSNNKTRRFKPTIPTERKKKVTEQSLPSSSTTLLNSIPEVVSTKKEKIENNNNNNNEMKSIIREVSDNITPSSPSPLPAKKKVSKFKQYQEQQRQKEYESNTVSTAGSKIKSKKGTPIHVPSRDIITFDDNAVVADEEKSSTKKKVSWEMTTSVREHDITSAPKESEGIYNKPLKSAATATMNNDIDDEGFIQTTIRSPSDIFRLVKHNQPTFKSDEDGYPILDDNTLTTNDITVLSEADIRELAHSARLNEPIDMFRPANGMDEDQLPTIHPFKPSSMIEPAQVKNKKMDTGIMRGNVLEREIESLDLDEVEDDMDLREIKSSYQRQRQNILATMGGLSFETKPEIEVFDEELPLPKDEQTNKDEDNEEIEKPKKVSRFKAARMAMMHNPMEQ
ncbi:hypothetical protein BJ944DRAFT_265900 [Cunninghamella echinulata]|nr:hypothetical protein BJ944DRAFT_265900 [Cunninghamella echinulata]